MDKYAQNVLWPQTEARYISRCNLASDTAVNAFSCVFFAIYGDITKATSRDSDIRQFLVHDITFLEIL